MHETEDRVEFSETRVRVFHTILARPEDGFTAQSLARTLALPSFEVRSALDELTADGLVAWTDGEYVSTP